ncbi:MAG: hypothetical protein ACR2PG_03580 [Hyphomicrobiaceae bacterium]
MKEILLSIILIVVIGGAVAYGLNELNWSAESKFISQTGNVRVD